MALLIRVPVQRHLLPSVRLTARRCVWRKSPSSAFAVRINHGCTGGVRRRNDPTNLRRKKIESFFVFSLPRRFITSAFHASTATPCDARAARALFSSRDRHRAALRSHPFDRRPRAGHRTNSARACARHRMEWSSRHHPHRYPVADSDRACTALSPKDDRVGVYRWRATARRRARVRTARTDLDDTANRQSPRTDASDQPSRRAFAMSPQPRATDPPSHALPLLAPLMASPKTVRPAIRTSHRTETPSGTPNPRLACFAR